ncbi:tyrosine-type recombinase/integrase [Ferrimonas marina]|uniref:Site-specific recombinase XerD n=1 Tax=Ferrimonas marina TaxID=299255 RepID=A0A1M5NEU5_9GAMM|nr:tyrosine-type recombinase/integrase [Ferrimonas marina]SHG88038.1 Site-specific recombinase XerD [Ferrimonas marina]
MSVELTLPTRSQLPTQFTAQVDKADLDRLSQFHRARFAEKTWQARQSDLRQYLIWCQAHGVELMHATAADVCLWLSHLASDNCLNRLRYQPTSNTSVLYAGKALAQRSIRRRLSSLKWFYDQKGQDNPVRSAMVEQQLAGIVRTLPSQARRAPGLLAPDLAELLDGIEETQFVDLRDKLILSLGFAGALRVSDLANLTVDSVQLHRRGLLLKFEQRKRKNQFSQLALLAGKDPRRCPKRLFEDYLQRLPNRNGPLLVRANRNGAPLTTALHPSSIARIIEKRGAAALSDLRFTGHSLRRGFIDSALGNGAPLSEVMKISGHQDPKTLMLYLNDIGDFADHPANGLY